MPQLSSLKLEDGRRGLVRFVEANRPQGSARNPITIVFDGQADVWGGESSPEVRVLFSRGETADDLIKKMAEAHEAAAGGMVVVTDDRELGYFCRAHGAGLWSVAQFLAQAKKTGTALRTGVRPKGPAPDKSEAKTLSDRTARQINAELSRLWIK